MDARKHGKSLNVVHNDEIWKDHIHRELYAQKRWPDRWGYLSQMYAEVGKLGKTKDSNEYQAKERQLEGDTDIPITEYTKKPFPQTTAQMIGWKSQSNQRHAYRVPEGRARGKSDIVRVFRWPREGQC